MKKFCKTPHQTAIHFSVDTGREKYLKLFPENTWSKRCLFLRMVKDTFFKYFLKYPHQNPVQISVDTERINFFEKSTIKTPVFSAHGEGQHFETFEFFQK